MSDVYHLRIQKATKSNLPSLSYTFEISDTCYPSLAQSISTNVYILQSEYIVLLGSKFHPCLKSILLLTCAAGLPNFSNFACMCYGIFPTKNALKITFVFFQLQSIQHIVGAK